MERQGPLDTSKNREKYRIWLTKEKEARYLSHHDIAQILEQSIRRANLDVCMAGHYNPRLKISFFSSVPVGVSSEGEPIEISFGRPISEIEIFETLQKKLPSHLNLRKVEKVSDPAPKNLKISYVLTLSSPISPQKVDDLIQQKTIVVTRHKKKQTIEIDIRPYILDCRLENFQEVARIYFTILMTPKGSASPWELLSLLGIAADDTNSISITRDSVQFLSSG